MDFSKENYKKLTMASAIAGFISLFFPQWYSGFYVTINESLSLGPNAREIALAISMLSVSLLLIGIIGLFWTLKKIDQAEKMDVLWASWFTFGFLMLLAPTIHLSICYNLCINFWSFTVLGLELVFSYSSAGLAIIAGLIALNSSDTNDIDYRPTRLQIGSTLGLIGSIFLPIMQLALYVLFDFTVLLEMININTVIEIAQFSYLLLLSILFGVIGFIGALISRKADNWGDIMMIVSGSIAFIVFSLIYTFLDIGIVDSILPFVLIGPILMIIGGFISLKVVLGTRLGLIGSLLMLLPHMTLFLIINFTVYKNFERIQLLDIPLLLTIGIGVVGLIGSIYSLKGKIWAEVTLIIIGIIAFVFSFIPLAIIKDFGDFRLTVVVSFIFIEPILVMIGGLINRVIRRN